MAQKQYYVYIITNRKNGVLYIGVTNNLQRRIYEHKNKLVDGFSKKYNLTNLVYHESTNQIENALDYEKRLKKWNPLWKIRLIEEKNPQWNDLYDALF